MITPIATYRLQLTADFGLAEAAGLLDHLVALGVSHVFLSPVLQATPGSTHGYDIVDTDRVDLARGGEEAFAALVASAHERGLGVMIDVVPNHMAAHETNLAWMDVLKFGLSSPFAKYFDVMWDTGSDDVHDRLLLPVLGTRLDDAIAAGDVRLQRRVGADPVVFVHETMYPLDPSTLVDIDTAPLRTVLDRQHYELAYWRDANERLDRRRFFDVNELIGVRQEDDEVRERTHRRIVQWCLDGMVDALRIDHPDGLTDPAGYLQWLRERSGCGWIVVEKILGPDERLPRDWPVEGTTGYDQSARIDGLFVDPRGQSPLDEVVRDITGEAADIEQVVTAAKEQALGDLFGAERRRLVRLATKLLPDATWNDVATAVTALVVAMPHYRTYVRLAAPAQEPDRRLLQSAAEHAALSLTASARAAIDELIAVFDRSPRTFDEDLFVVRYQQLTAAVTAKGVEDTAFYRFPRLLALNEVGADPGRFGTEIERFHDEQSEMASRHPLGLVALSTHDSKRSGDARHRLAVLSEMAAEYASAIRRLWLRLDELVGGDERDALVDLTLVQMVLAAHPIDRDRMQPAAIKAAREAKRRTSWYEPDPAYESGVERVVDALLADDRCRVVLDELLVDLIPYGRRNSLGASLIAALVPGVPDLYQGAEAWALSLADPDNRRPLDLDAVRAAVHADRSVWTPAFLSHDGYGATKGYLLRNALAARREHPDCVGPHSAYAPLVARGAMAHHLVGFRRGQDLAVVVARWERTLARGGGWQDTSIELPAGRWRDRLSGLRHEGRVTPDAVLGAMPCALLERA